MKRLISVLVMLGVCGANIAHAMTLTTATLRPFTWENDLRFLDGVCTNLNVRLRIRF